MIYKIIRGKLVSLARKVAKVRRGVKCAPVTGPSLKIKSVTMKS